MANNDFYRYAFYQKLLGLDRPPAPASTVELSALLGLPTPPAPVPAPQGIRFLHAHFSEPVTFVYAWLPKVPGIYAILVFDGACRPRPFRVLYFGKAEDLAARVVASHEKYSDWQRAVGVFGSLYVSYYTMEGTSNWQRADLEESLIKHYAPECNRTFNPFSGLLGY